MESKWTSERSAASLPGRLLGPPWRSWALLVVLLGGFCSNLARHVCFWAHSRAILADLGAILLLLGHIIVDLGRIFDALTTLRIELPPARELDFRVFTTWSVTTLRKQNLLAHFA